MAHLDRDGRALALVRASCLALPGASERLSHGRPAFFTARGRMFASFQDDHHGDGRLAVWCAAPAGAQDGLVGADPQRWFVPPYVGHRGWVGLRLEGCPAEEIAGALEEAHAAVEDRSRRR